jgi:hypothetical protein
MFSIITGSIAVICCILSIILYNIDLNKKLKYYEDLKKYAKNLYNNKK